jgi:hypothetical protein
MILEIGSKWVSSAMINAGCGEWAEVGCGRPNGGSQHMDTPASLILVEVPAKRAWFGIM